MVKAYGITPRHIMSFALVSLLCATAQADDYVVVVGSYVNDNNAQKAQIRVANYLRQSGMAAQAQIIESAGRLRVAVVASEQPSQSLLRRLRQGPYIDAWRLKTDGSTSVVSIAAVKPVPVTKTQSLALKQMPNKTAATTSEPRAKKEHRRENLPSRLLGRWNSMRESKALPWLRIFQEPIGSAKVLLTPPQTSAVICG